MTNIVEMMRPIKATLGTAVPATSDARYNDRVREILNIQSEHMERWELVLKPEVYGDLSIWIDKKNREWVRSSAKPDPYMITRGTDIDRYISNLTIHLSGGNPSHPSEWL